MRAARVRGDRGIGEGAEMRKGKKAGRGSLAQELMPLESVTGSIMRMRDGACCVALAVEGRNDSLDTLGQKRAAGDALARCLRGVGRTLLMLRLPRAVDATAALVHIDDEAAALRERMFPLPEGRERRALEVRHDLLVGRLRPRSEREALAGDKVDARTFFVLRFEPDSGCDDRRMLEEASMLAEALTSAGMRAEPLRQDGVVEMLQMYFTPRAVDASRAEGALASAVAQAARSAAAAKVCGFVVIASIIPKNAASLPPVNFPKFALENRGEFSL